MNVNQQLILDIESGVDYVDRGISSPLNLSLNQPIDEVATFETSFTLPPEGGVCGWQERSSDRASIGKPKVIHCKLVDATVYDSEITREIVDNKLLKLGGVYGFDTFSNITYKYKNTDTDEIIEGSGLPFPNDPYIKNMFEIKIDPLSAKDVHYIVEFIVEFTISNDVFAENDDTLYIVGDKAYRRDRFNFIQTVRNLTGSKMGTLLRTALNANN